MNPQTPGATYRLQFHHGFRFVDGRDLVPYLSELGITDLYSSPRYKARRGSSHGYDIANPLRVNSELGTEEDFDEMAEKLRHYDMGLLLDTVPNHMAASYENPWWTDVLENGQASAYASYFDIDWHSTAGKAAFLQEGRVLLPILGELYGDALANGCFTLKIEDTGMHVKYYETRLPLDPKSYTLILEACPQCLEMGEIFEAIDSLPDRDETDPERVIERRRNKDRIKERLWKAYQSNPALRQSLDAALMSISGWPDGLDAVLSRQAYRLAYWQIGYEEINYRRFFDINDLVALRIELPEVFDNRMRKTIELACSGKVTGLRIDHIDGLWDPECYLRRLQSKASREGARPFYLVVEKILGRDEGLPKEWPVSGTTGYDFLNAVNGIFIDPEGLKKLEEIHARRTGNHLPFAEVCYSSTKLVMQKLFTGDVNVLAQRLGRLAAYHRQARDVRLSELTEALIEVIACLPVYRTYIHDSHIPERDRGYIEDTVALARRRTSPDKISDAAFDFLQSVLLLDPPDYLEERKPEWLDFVMRWQQFTGPVMAKGLEDTANYRDGTLLSVNEVGGDPVRDRPPFSVRDFHEFNQVRLREWPDTMSATSTHDTKRGEDARARLNVLSEMPEEWDRRLELWMGWNAAKKVVANGGELAPSAGEEIIVYQTLLGAWPSNADEEAAFAPRLQEFVVKALREAKQNSSWMAPRESYERAVQDFVGRILEPDSEFARDFAAFRAEVVRRGARNGLGQLLLKVASPGVPDFYQGSEFWNFSLVDPDNRRSVDYKRRTEMLDALRRREQEDRIALIRELAADPSRDQMKLWVTQKALRFRKSNRELFARGEYLPIDLPGACAFARRLGECWVVVVAPLGRGEPDGAELELPDGAPEAWHDVLTGLIPGSHRLADLLKEFPVAMLAGLNT
jgi:(1->4)-alpha-D-glucan 1-alpha-D-glucosylmutase